MGESWNNVWYRRTTSRTVVVFVHGVLSDNLQCWTNRRTASYWPRLVGDDPQFEDPAIFLAGYPSSVSSGRFDVLDAADQVFQSLRTADQPPSPLEKARMLFVCHSQGGIVVRRMLCNYHERFADKHVGLLLCGSPSWGSFYASTVAPLLRAINHAQGYQLRHGAPELVALDRDFQQLIDLRRIPSLKGRCLVETRGPLWPLVWRLVHDETASRYFVWQRIPGVSHSALVKPASMTEPSHVALRFFALEGGFLTRRPLHDAAVVLRQAMHDVNAAFDPARGGGQHQQSESIERVRNAAREVLAVVDRDDRLIDAPVDRIVRATLDASRTWAFYDLSRDEFTALGDAVDRVIARTR
jgi:hypothetical protein